MTTEETLMLLKQGIQAARQGQVELARELLQWVTETEPDNELGWLWLAGVVASPQEAAVCLQRVIEINPSNERALAGLKWAQSQTQTPAPSSPDWNCPFCSSTAPAAQTVCSSCGTILVLDDLDALIGNPAADRSLLQGAIERYAQTTNGNDFATHYYHGLAHLNLGQLDAGLAQMQQARQLQPHDDDLRAQVNLLLQRQAQIQAEKAASIEQAPPRTVLIIDDSPTVRKLVSITLSKQQYHVIQAQDGMEALAVLSDQLPDLIFLDITMPRMDGYQLCKIIKGNPDTEHIPVVMLSGKDGFFDKVRGRMAGATEYITKPFRPTTLLQAVQEHLLNGTEG